MPESVLSRRLNSRTTPATAESQHERQRDLDDDEAVAQATERPRAGRAAAGRPGDVLRLRPRDHDRRRQTEGHRHDGAHAQQKRERHPVERDLVRARNPGRADPDEQIERPARHDDACHSAQEREQQALDEELADEAPGTRAERRASDHLVRSRGGSGEEQVPDVGAGRGEHQSDRAEHQPERLVNLAAHVVGERHQLHAERPVGPGGGHIQPLLDGIELSERRANRHSGFQAAGHVSESPASQADIGHPQVGAELGLRPGKGG